MPVKHYLTFSLIFINIGLIIMLLFDPITIHLAMTPKTASFWDPIMANLTHLGDGLTPVIVLAILSFFISFKKWITGIATSIIAGVLAQFFKKIVFPDYMRPAALIDHDLLHFVEGVKIHHMYSFPSGHTTTAFALFIFLAFVWHHKAYVQIILALATFFVAYTRIYLSQHFLMDTVFGALLGIVSFVIAYELIYKKIPMSDAYTVFQLRKNRTK